MNGLRRRLLAVAIVLGALVAVAPAIQALVPWPESDADRQKRHRQVLDDKTPSAQDVIDVAGAPMDVNRGKDGSTLLSYCVTEVDDDEGYAAGAWRLYDRKGKVRAEAAYHTDQWEAPGSCDGSSSFITVEGGFLHESDDFAGPFFLGPAGKRHLTRSKKPLEHRRGDVLLDRPDQVMLFRRSNLTLAPAKGIRRIAEPDFSASEMDGQGTIWGYPQTTAPDTRLSWVTRRGHGHRETRSLPGELRGGDLDARGGTVAVVLEKRLGREVTGEDKRRFAGLFLSVDNGKSWRTLRNSARAPLGTLATPGKEVDVQVLGDGRVLLVPYDEDGPTYSNRKTTTPPLLADSPENRSFHKVTRPTPHLHRIFARGNTLYGIVDAANSYNLVEGEGLWLSHDGGRSWSRFP
ncbi:hypothetical protein ITI46_04495 [Streptomyces oryzae]|uniref:Sialidase domain-containing protein n=1 Tax=Streptomyces oryzae TaxID=1434886 RepID=A0ABS3X6F1_9ACTN|nr:hypothetical protein [Streptomyces oryzae]MBO8190958.1 hypothetical protein [Streptomyces oryzae]